MFTRMPGLFAVIALCWLVACQPASVPAPTATPPPARTDASPTPTATPAIPLASPTPEFAPHPILGDRRVRQALAFCTDRAALVRSVYPWLDEPETLVADSIVPPRHPAYAGDAADFTRYPFDAQQGMALLDEAGWKLVSGAAYRTNASGAELALTLTTTESSFRKAWTEAWVEQMAACGVHILLNPQPAEWLFGADSGLSHREVELAAFAWQAGFDSGALDAFARYACEQVPSSDNGWQGQNFSGWCNPIVDPALQEAVASLEPAVQLRALQRLQVEYSRELPELPLFYRLDLFAANPGLENFDPPEDGMHTWNAAQWRIPGRDTIIIGEDGEPAAPLWFEPAYVAGVIRTLIMGSDVVPRAGAYQPVMLKELPSLDNGGVTLELATVREGDRVVDWRGEVVELQPGALVADADGIRHAYAGGEIVMRQLVVTYQFVDGLAWSDGAPVSAADYELGYRALCDPAVRGEGPFSVNFPDPAPACDRIAAVEFLSDAAYRVAWLPGFSGARLGYADLPYFLPPFSRLPAHQAVSDGRKLAETPFREWFGLDEVLKSPLGAGPYVLKNWTYGQGMLLEANPHYFAGPPATPRIEIRFLEHEQALRALAAGEVDLLDWETIGPQDVEAFQLVQAQQEGRVRLVRRPSNTWELLSFKLRLP